MTYILSARHDRSALKQTTVYMSRNLTKSNRLTFRRRLAILRTSGFSAVIPKGNKASRPIPVPVDLLSVRL